MATDVQPYRIAFPEGFDAQAEAEVASRGYLTDVVVQVEGGTRHRLSFVDPVRLEQELADNAGMGRPYFAEPGLVVLPEVTTEAIRTAVRGLWEEGFFGRGPGL